MRLDSVGKGSKSDRLATMAATPPEIVGAQRLFPGSPVGRGGSHRIHSLNEHFRQPDCLPQRADEEVPHRVDREPSRELTIGIDRPSCERPWRNLSDVAVFDGRRYMVAGN